MSRQRSTKVPRYVFDSGMFISLIKNEVPRGSEVVELLKQAQEGKIEVLYSYGALPEIRHPSPLSAQGAPMKQVDIEALFEHEEIQMVAVEREIGAKARRILINAPKGMSVTDAILVATAIIYDANALFTYDMEHLIKHDGRWDGLKICYPYGQWQTPLPFPSEQES